MSSNALRGTCSQYLPPDMYNYLRNGSPDDRPHTRRADSFALAGTKGLDAIPKFYLSSLPQHAHSPVVVSLSPRRRSADAILLRLRPLTPCLHFLALHIRACCPGDVPRMQPSSAEGFLLRNRKIAQENIKFISMHDGHSPIRIVTFISRHSLRNAERHS
ncbi:hypothetical protein DFP72DRAFT_361944 [Ephemerocybe angulata]|uniref:Uncharacterized protein n=1 Tax=Ephemerocybe angulata TaxID=980116 RepID=A0A8H6HXE1_9AGAR|nr:hypothetical protein DFP72DRAFT_361944 [Tulosesus angulatus]